MKGSRYYVSPAKHPAVTTSLGTMNKVQVDLRVGMLDVSLAQLLTNDHHLIEFPTLLLPDNVKAGSIIRLTCERDVEGEAKDKSDFEEVQHQILETFTTHLPQAPILHVRNVTQTSVVLDWDPIDIGASDLYSLALYKNGQRLGIIPTPLKRTSTKLSNLATDQKYSFHMVLSTSAGEFVSEPVEIKTHKMTDLSGIVICVGSLENSDIGRQELEEVVQRLGCHPVQDSVKLDTTHFVCTNEEGRQCQKAKDLSIPIVRPEWLKACETERRLVGVRSYYVLSGPSSTSLPRRENAAAPITNSSPPTIANQHAVANTTGQRQEGASEDSTKEAKDAIAQKGNEDATAEEPTKLQKSLTLQQELHSYKDTRQVETEESDVDDYDDPEKSKKSDESLDSKEPNEPQQPQQLQDLEKSETPDPYKENVSFAEPHGSDKLEEAPVSPASNTDDKSPELEVHTVVGTDEPNDSIPQSKKNTSRNDFSLSGKLDDSMISEIKPVAESSVLDAGDTPGGALSSNFPKPAGDEMQGLNLVSVSLNDGLDDDSENEGLQHL